MASPSIFGIILGIIIGIIIMGENDFLPSATSLSYSCFKVSLSYSKWFRIYRALCFLSSIKHGPTSELASKVFRSSILSTSLWRSSVQRLTGIMKSSEKPLKYGEDGSIFSCLKQPNAFSVLVISEKGCLLSAPDTYMEKIVIGSNLPEIWWILIMGLKKILSY